MISVDISGHRFQLRAAAVVTHEGFVLLHQREGDNYWALPGGRVEPGEDARMTVEREMAEELNEEIECGELLYVVENFFEHEGKPNHEIGLYFQAKIRSNSIRLDKSQSHAGSEAEKFLKFHWFRMEDVPQLNLRPFFLRESLANPMPSFKHVVQRG